MGSSQSKVMRENIKTPRLMKQMEYKDVYMESNVAYFGGCVYAHGQSDLTFKGGCYFNCTSARNGGFLFVSSGGTVNIFDGLYRSGDTRRRGGSIYVSGTSQVVAESTSILNIFGGIFRENVANELGSVIAAWGITTLVNVTGGVFQNNSAVYYGGSIFLEEFRITERESLKLSLQRGR